MSARFYVNIINTILLFYHNTLSAVKMIKKIQYITINQTQVAKILNTSQTVYSRYERDERDLPIDYLITLCKLYNVSADYILGFTDKIIPLPEK